MKCPNCNSTETVKNGRRKERQSHMCKHCGRQFPPTVALLGRCETIVHQDVPEWDRGIERVTNIHHTTVMHWIAHAGHELTDAPASDEIPEITDLDELQTFVGKSDKNLALTAANHWRSGILACVGDRAETFKRLWWIVRWQAFGMERWLYGLSSVH